MIDVSATAVERRDRPSSAVIPMPEATPMQMLAIAVQQGADLSKIEKLMELQQRWDGERARKSFVAAMSAFKSEPMSILKSKQVNIPGGAKFAHATLADVVDGVVAGLSKHGLSHKWELHQEGDRVTVTCIITHEAGHSERTALSGLPDDSGKKNGIQQIASTVTYLQRYTLMAATGLAAKDMDDDGRGGKSTKPKLSEEQIANIEALLTEVGSNKVNFLKWARVEAIEDILASNYSACIQALEQKRKA
jgi:hypothetical protein